MFQSEFRRGWPAIVAALLGYVVYALPPYTVGLFIGPLRAAFGWNRAEVSLGVTLFTLTVALTAPVFGVLSERWGAAKLAILGIVAFAGSFSLLGAMGGSIAVYWSIMVGMAVLGAGCSPVTLSRLVIDRFEKRRGLALGLSMTGPAIGALAAPLFIALLIASLGWRGAYQSLAATVLCLAPLAAFMLWLNARNGVAESAASGPAEGDPKGGRQIFWLVFVAFLLVSMSVGGAVVHLVPMLGESGFTRAQAATIAGVMGATLLLVRLLTGFAVDRFAAVVLASVVMAISAVGFLALALVGPPLMALAPVIVGLALGAELDLIAYITSRFFPVRAYGRSFGGLFFAFQLGLGLSPLIYGAIRDQTHTYGPALTVSALGLAISGIIFFSLRQRWSALSVSAR
jgi:MFS family permease